VSLSLRDNGTGLDLPCDQDKVFGLFQRAHVVPDRAGVSLHAVRRLLQHNGGRIEVAGALDEGCTFTVHFPAAAQAEPA
jgi:light-regulated signal transduction histidine kinase (bacteriophytochrome)